MFNVGTWLQKYNSVRRGEVGGYEEDSEDSDEFASDEWPSYSEEDAGESGSYSSSESSDSGDSADGEESSSAEQASPKGDTQRKPSKTFTEEALPTIENLDTSTSLLGMETVVPMPSAQDEDVQVTLAEARRKESELLEELAPKSDDTLPRNQPGGGEEVPKPVTVKRDKSQRLARTKSKAKSRRGPRGLSQSMKVPGKIGISKSSRVPSRRGASSIPKSVRFRKAQSVRRPRKGTEDATERSSLLEDRSDEWGRVYEGTRRSSVPLLDDDDFSALARMRSGDDLTRKEKMQRSAMRWYRRMPYYVAILYWLPNYKWREYLLPDILAGIAVVCLIVPQALAYALLAGLPPQYGLYTAFVPLVVYMVMGHSRQLSIGPEALMAILVGLTIQKMGIDPVEAACLLSFLVGCFVLLLGLFRLGFIDVLLSRPLLAGFVNAVALTIMIEQIDTLLGVTDPFDHSWHKLVFIFKHPQDVHALTSVIGLSCAAALLLMSVVKRWASRLWKPASSLPETLLVVGVMVAISYGVGLADLGVATLGDIESGLPRPRAPVFRSLESVTDNMASVAMIGVLGFIESMVAAKVYAQKHDYSVSPNRELVAYGLANFVGAFFGAFPTFGSLPRTGVADTAGARTQAYNVVVIVTVALTMLLLGPIFAYLPKTAAAAVIFAAAVHLFEFHDLLFLYRMRAWSELSVSAFTFLLTLIIGVEYGIIISLLISIFIVLKRTSVPHIGVLGRLPGTSKYKDVTVNPLAEEIPNILVIRVEESLMFYNIAQVKEMFTRIEHLGAMHAHPGDRGMSPASFLKGIVLDCHLMPAMDASALQTFAELVTDYRRRNVRLSLVKPRDNLKRQFIVSGVIEPTGANDVFTSIHEAVIAMQGVEVSGLRTFDRHEHGIHHIDHSERVVIGSKPDGDVAKSTTPEAGVAHSAAQDIGGAGAGTTAGDGVRKRRSTKETHVTWSNVLPSVNSSAELEDQV